MTGDPRALSELLEESQDLQADALRPTRDALDEIVEAAQGSGDEDVESQPGLPCHTSCRAVFELLQGNAARSGWWCRPGRRPGVLRCGRQLDGRPDPPDGSLD